MSLFKEISNLLSGLLTEEDEQAVEDELADILKQQLPEVPSATIIGDEVSEEEKEPTRKGIISKYFFISSDNVLILEKTRQKNSKEPVALEV